MLTATEEKIDQDLTLKALETLIDKRRRASTLRETVNQQHREVTACDTEERKATQLVDQLEGRVKSYCKQLLLGAAKAGELPTLKQQLIEAKESLSRRRQALQERSEDFCLSQETLTQLLTEIGELSRQLRDDLTRLYMQRFHEHDTGLYGKRGQISWKEDENSPERYSRQWRGRVFNFLLFKGFASDVNESQLLHALVAFFRQASFSVRVAIGFVPTSTRSKEPLGVGEVIAVPKQLSEGEAFEEIVRRRVEFVEGY
ncbi:MAG: hypothetical protein P0120_07795 [Nitrospira sp.]|nr:hypothetical protein [Nitrospira sp.]